MKKYVYDGPVMYFDRIVDYHWKSETMAISEAKARSNMTYVYKRTHGYAPNSAIHLSGEVQMVCDLGEQITFDM